MIIKFNGKLLFKELFIFLLLTFPIISTAIQPIDPAASSAFSYLSGQQQGDGTYSVLSPTTTNYHITARVTQSLAHAFPSSPEFGLSQSFLNGSTLTTIEELSRRLLVAESLPDLATIQASQNADGGYGAEIGFSSNVLDTALAVTAMKKRNVPIGSAGHNITIQAGGSHVVTVDVPVDISSMEISIESITNPIEVRIAEGSEPIGGVYFPISASSTFISLTPTTIPPVLPGTNYIKFTAPTGTNLSFTINYTTPSATTNAATDAIKYLLAAQNADRGWGFNASDDDSRLYYSYWASSAVVGLIDPSTLSTYIQSKERVGGGLSDSGPATTFDTSVGLLALANVGVDANTVIPDSIAYLDSSQQLNGSFEDDAFVTAWGLDALLATHAPLPPTVTSNGGAGTGQNFITNQGVITITGFAPVGALGVAINIPSATVTFDTATGQYVIIVNLSEGLNNLEITAFNLSGAMGNIRALQATRNSTLLSQSINLVKGLNQIGLTLNPANSLTAQGLLELLGNNALEVQQYNSITGQFDIIRKDGSGNFMGVDFSLTGLDGVNVIATDAAITDVVGNSISSATIDFKAGLNTLTIPNPPVGMAAFDLLALIGNELVVSNIQRFNQQTGVFESAIYAGSEISGINFPIESGVAYYVHMHQDLTGFVIPVNIDVSITINSPSDGATITTTPLTVAGTVTGAAPLAVTVNGVTASVTGNSYTASIPLSGTGVVPITATVVDGLGASKNTTITINYDSVDFVLSIGTSISGIANFSTTPTVITQVAFYTQSLVGLPAGVTYTTDSFQLYSDGNIQAGFTIAATGSAVPGVYTFQVTYGLLDTGSNPLGPLTGNTFVFKFAITP